MAPRRQVSLGTRSVVQACLFGEHRGLGRPPGRTARHRTGVPSRIQAGQAGQRRAQHRLGRECLRPQGARFGRAGNHLIEDARGHWAEKAVKQRRSGLAAGADHHLVVGIRHHPDQMPVASIEGQIHACHWHEPGLTGRPGRAAFENHLASVRLITRREVVHDYTPHPAA